jgi:site-specific recombinase XerD
VLENGSSVPMERALFSTLYLTGARVREIVPYEEVEGVHIGWRGLTKDQVKFMPSLENPKIVLFGELPTEKQWKREYCLDKKGNYIKEYSKQYKKKVRKIKKKDMQYVPRIITVHYEKEKEFCDAIKEYLLTLNKPGTTILFDFTREYAWQIVKKMSSRCGIDIWPHYLRHSRTTDLVTLYGLRDMELKQFHGWHDTRPSKTYVHLDWQHLAKIQGISEEVIKDASKKLSKGN